jgi:hypothetical protein
MVGEPCGAYVRRGRTFSRPAEDSMFVVYVTLAVAGLVQLARVQIVRPNGSAQGSIEDGPS